MALGSYYVTYAGLSCTEYGVYPVNRPSIPTGTKRTTAVQIPGHDGDVYIEDGAVNDIRIQITFDFRAASPSDWGAGFRQLKRWIDSGSALSVRTEIRELRFSDDPDYIYSVKQVEIGTTERTAKTIGRATVTFICEGWAYLLSSITGSDVKTTTTFTVTNPTSYPARPILQFRAPAGFALSLSYDGGTAETFEVASGNSAVIRIDTRSGLIYYTESGASALARTVGDIDVFEVPGGSTLSATLASGSTSAFVYLPMWREL